MEMGLYDVPASIDFIIEATGFQKVAYVGHSQGTTQMFSVLSDHEDLLADKISAFVALGPATKITNIGHPAVRVEAHYLTAFAQNLAKKFNYYSFGSNDQGNDLVAKLKFFVCHLTGPICKDVKDWLDSSEPKYDDTSRYYVSMSHSAGASPVKSIIHYA